MKLRNRQKGANLIQESHQSFAGTATNRNTSQETAVLIHPRETPTLTWIEPSV